MPNEVYIQSEKSAFRRKQEPTWSRPRKRLEDTLSFQEVVFLRRIRNGERNVDIARALDVTPSTVGSALGAARRRFGVDTTADLLKLPRVIELLGGGDHG